MSNTALKTTALRGQIVHDINDWDRSDFDALPCRKWDEEIGEFDSLVILPTDEIHDSGYRLMDFVAVRAGEPICRLSGCSDVLHINGIGGFGLNWLKRYNGVPSAIPPVDWSIDCLAKSGLLQLFIGRTKLVCGSALSSFEIYAVSG